MSRGCQAWRSSAAGHGGACSGVDAGPAEGPDGPGTLPQRKLVVVGLEESRRANWYSVALQRNQGLDCVVQQRFSLLRVPKRAFAWDMFSDIILSMRLTYVTAAVGIAIAVPLVAPVALIEASSAHADISGYRRCVGNVKEVPLSQPDPQSLQLARLVEMDLKSGVSSAAEAQKVAQMGFEPQLANAVVQCAMQNNP